MRHRLPVLIAAVLLAASRCAAGGLAFENPRLRAVLGEDAVWRSVVAKGTGKDCCPKERRLVIAVARVGGKTHAARRAALDGGRLTLGFHGLDTSLRRRPTGSSFACSRSAAPAPAI
jgi:hypothetical protein